ncbi:NAD(P)/FAD-dependent oxidoreductase [Xenorhabdus sp. DI]|uniref:phytoene desaturase family protein n=1 Tax=Xenorhabdus doucetiae TaxID=351671 RepID=UPI0019B84E7B|nr:MULTISPECIES: NAD(P)/FAD-dependent oxidoreductase [unclassified Xenorhabdus]MBD2783279.1 NAD(P)/FAD-dependent oxidoreductase [Xenorhabdus sp. 3]MBD2788036.1 NAD(P)/FAD-dependent oxidoreductase [Xenorhabdus sp. DI]
MTASKPQVIIVGSGINSLVCAALLAKWGKSVLVLERNAVLGGCIRTEALFPGYTHDVLSCWYPLFLGSPAYQELKPALEKAGVEFLHSDYSTGLVQPNGKGIALKREMLAASLQLDEVAAGANDGEALMRMAQQILHDDAALIFGLLGHNPYGFTILKLLFSEWRKRGIDGLTAFAGSSLETFRRWAERELQSGFSRALIAPWVLHTGLGPDDASSALIGKLTFAAVVAGGMPVVKGGSIRLVDALKGIIEQHGGQLITEAHVDRIITHQRGKQRRASGVLVAEQIYHASEAVVCNVIPQQLYGHLLSNVPDAVRQRAQNYRYGRGGMQVHFALNRPPPWREPELRHVPLVHLTESMEQVCLSVTQANNGYLPGHPTLAIGQPTALDPSRAPEGGWILWVQMQELPTHLKGDALGEIPIPADGQWNNTVCEAVADRVQARLETVMPGFSSFIVGRKAYSPADLQALNCNLSGGDPYSGICSPDQFFWLRPFAASQGTKGHQTPVSNVFHIGASTHPGPGLSGTSGYLVARRLARR